MYGSRFSGSNFNIGFGSAPSAIKVIIIINVAVFLLQMLTGNLLTDFFAFVTDWSITLIQPWRIVTYMFLHSGGWHLIFNMLWLWWMGQQVESTIGPRTFTSLYLLSGIIGAALHLILAPLIGVASVIGASGAVYGIMVSFAVLYPRAPIMLLLLPPIEARYVVGGIIALDILFLGTDSNVARLVHLGGAAAGYFLIKWHQKGTHIARWIDYIIYYWEKLSTLFSSGSLAKIKIKHSGGKPVNRNMRMVQDAEIIEEIEQNELDRILDKIAQSGYDALTDEEKQKLFEMSKKK